MVDSANVVGSVPDGWWRDRVGATSRVRDALAEVSRSGLRSSNAPAALRDGPLEVVLVVEGKARGVASIEAVEVVAAPGSGDDAIVEVVASRGAGRPCFVATADRGLIARVQAHGARIVGPRSVRSR